MGLRIGIFGQAPFGRDVAVRLVGAGHDIVYVHVASEGEADGRLQRIEYVRAFRPREVAGVVATAISWTTAGSVVAVIEMVRQGMLGPKGFVKQEEIPFELFSSTATGALFAG